MLSSELLDLIFRKGLNSAFLLRGRGIHCERTFMRPLLTVRPQAAACLAYAWYGTDSHGNLALVNTGGYISRGRELRYLILASPKFAPSTQCMLQILILSSKLIRYCHFVQPIRANHSCGQISSTYFELKNARLYVPSFEPRKMETRGSKRSSRIRKVVNRVIAFLSFPMIKVCYWKVTRSINWWYFER